MQVEQKSQKNEIKTIKTEWTCKQDELLLYIINNIGCKWKFISKYFPDKSIFQLYSRYMKINPFIKRSKFTNEEDSKLTELVQIHGFNWAKFSAIFKGRNPKQLRYRFIKYLSKNYDDSEILEEEKRIIYLNYPLIGNKWGEYTKLLDRNRSPAFIRKALFKN